MLESVEDLQTATEYINLLKEQIDFLGRHIVSYEKHSELLERLLAQAEKRILFLEEQCREKQSWN